MNKLVFVLLGKTGSGKSTILNMIREVKGNRKTPELHNSSHEKQ